MGVRITALPSLVGQLADDDLFEAVDTSDVSVGAEGTSKSFTGLQIKQYVAWRLKDPVHTLSTIPLTLATALVPGQTVGGRVLEEDDRVLPTAQADPGENGIWVVQASGPPERANDFIAGMGVSCVLVPVSDGDNANSVWICTSELGVDVVGADPLYFASLAGIGPTGPAGPQGVQGDPGPQGDPGADADPGYLHTQGSAATTWVIPHNRGDFIRAWGAIDGAGVPLVGELANIDSDNAEFRLNIAKAGTILVS